MTPLRDKAIRVIVSDFGGRGWDGRPRSAERRPGGMAARCVDALLAAGMLTDPEECARTYSLISELIATGKDDDAERAYRLAVKAWRRARDVADGKPLPPRDDEARWYAASWGRAAGESALRVEERRVGHAEGQGSDRHDGVEPDEPPPLYKLGPSTGSVVECYRIHASARRSEWHRRFGTWKPAPRDDEARIERAARDDEAVDAVTRACREADPRFVAEGGSTRHWARDHFLPALRAEGYVVALAAADQEEKP